MGSPWEAYKEPTGKKPWESFSAPAPVQPPAPQSSALLDAGDTLHEFVGGISEPVAKFASGMVAKPLSDVAGLAKGTYDLGRRFLGMGQQGANAQEAKDYVQNALTYTPRTEAGKSDYNPLNAIPNAIGSAINAVSPNPPEEAGVSPTSLEGAARLGVREAIPQALGIAGVRYGPQIANSVGQASKTGAQKLMVNALKPTPTQVISGDADVAAQQMLKRGINPNTAGVVEINKIIDDLHNQVESSIAGSTANTSKQAVIDSLERVKNDFMYKPNLEVNQARIAKAGEEFSNNPVIPDETIPVQVAQKLKRGYQKAVADDYGQESTAGMESNKAIAAKLREGIEKAHPEVAPLNAEQKALIDTLGVIERKAAMNRTAEPVPTSGALKGVGPWAAMAANKSSMFKARLAQALDSVGNTLSSPTPEIQVQAPQTRRIQLNQDIPNSALPNLGNPPVIPQSWNEGLQPKQTQTPLPVIPDQLNPLSEQYPQGIPIGAAEGRMPQQSTPLPKLYPDPRPTMELAEPQATAQALRQQPETVNFPLKTEVLQQPEIVKATNAFRLQAQQLQEAIASETNGFKKAQLEAQLIGLQNRFGKGAHLLGGESAADFYGPNYQSGTRFGVDKTFDGKSMAAQLRSR